MTKVALPRISELKANNDYNGRWRIELSQRQWLALIDLLKHAYPPGQELFAPPSQLEDALASWYYCREQTQRQVGYNQWNNVGTSNVVILKTDEQMTYFQMMKGQLPSY